jgi:PAS domain S-box-containing protein
VEAQIRRHTGEALSGYLELAYFQVEGRTYFLVHITEKCPLQQAERELAHSRRRFEAVFANATIGIIVCDRARNMVSANELAGQLFGYAAAELLGQRIEVLVPDAAGRQHALLRESFNKQPQVRSMGAHRGDLVGLRKDSSEFPVEASLSYFHLDEELYVVAYVLDVTAKKNAEQELIGQQQRVTRLNADLEQKVADRTHALLNTLEQLEQRGRELTQALAAEQELGELKSRFVSMASHEFRTPLTGVLTSAELIAEAAGRAGRALPAGALSRPRQRGPAHGPAPGPARGHRAPLLPFRHCRTRPGPDAGPEPPPAPGQRPGAPRRFSPG